MYPRFIDFKLSKTLKHTLEHLEDENIIDMVTLNVEEYKDLRSKGASYVQMYNTTISKGKHGLHVIGNNNRHCLVWQLLRNNRNPNCEKRCPNAAHITKLCQTCGNRANSELFMINNLYSPKLDTKEKKIKFCGKEKLDQSFVAPDMYCRNTIKQILITPISVYHTEDTRNPDTKSKRLFALNMTLYHIGGDICSRMKLVSHDEMEIIIEELADLAQQGIGIELLTVFNWTWDGRTHTGHNEKVSLLSTNLDKLQSTDMIQEGTPREDTRINKPISLYLFALDCIVRNNALRKHYYSIQCFARSINGIPIKGLFNTTYKIRRQVSCLKWNVATFSNLYLKRTTGERQTSRTIQNIMVT